MPTTFGEEPKNQTRAPSTMNGVSLQDLLLIEDDASILEFRCSATGIPLWTQIRTAVFRMMISDICYSTALDGQANAGVAKSQALVTMSQSMLHNFQFRLGGRS